MLRDVGIQTLIVIRFVSLGYPTVGLSAALCSYAPLRSVYNGGSDAYALWYEAHWATRPYGFKYQIR